LNETCQNRLSHRSDLLLWITSGIIPDP